MQPPEPSPAPPDPPLERIRLLGRGATGRVELARLGAPLAGLAAGAEVAVKTLDQALRDDARARAAFEAEAEAGMAVEHPSLVRVLHRGEGPEGPYLLMQYVPGRSLREILDADGSLPEPLVRSAGAQVSAALAALHDHELVHGDVKPENVRLDEAGRAVLLDLGFARRAASRGPTPGAGSLAYLSPERAAGKAPSPPADVFALGVVLYELAAGIHPFASTRSTAPTRASTGGLLRRSIELPGADELLASISSARYVPPSHFDPRLSPLLDALLEEALRRAPSRRPTATSLARRLREGEAGAWWRGRVDQEAGRPDAGAARGAPHLTPLVGREPELARLDAALGRVRLSRDGAERSEVVWLSGPEGVGKWRLVQGFAARARASDEPPLYLFARWSESAEARSAGAMSLLLHRWLRLPLDTAPGQRERNLLRELVAPRTVRTLVRALDPERAAEAGDSVPAALAEWLRALGARTPTIVFLDDLHRSGAVTLEALSILIDRLEETRVLLVLGVREDVPPAQPELLDRLASHLSGLPDAGVGFQRVDLGPLSEEDVLALVTRLFDRKTPRMRLARELWRRSRGNPGLLNEILRDLLQRGDVRARHEEGGEDGGELELLVSPDRLPQPRSLDRIVAERSSGLDREHRAWLERLAVVGGRIQPEFLVRAFPPTTRGEIDSVLADLVRLGWLVPRGDRYRFDRPTLREAVYRAIAPDRRRRLHRAAARGLEGALGEAAETEEAFQRAFHLRAAHEDEALLETVTAHLASARRRTSSRRLWTLARWGLEALERLPRGPERTQERLALLEVAADATDRLGHREEERRVLDRLHESDLDLEREPRAGARLYLLHGRYAAGTGQFGLARGLLRNAVELAEKAGDPGLSSEALRRLALVQGQVGELEEAAELARESLAQARGENQVALARLALAQLDVLVDRVEDALRQVERALADLRGSAEVRLGILGHANLLRGRIQRSAGRPLRALGAVHRAVRLAGRAGERRLEAEARARLGGLLLDLDRREEAEVQLRDALLLAEEIEDRRGETLARIWLAILLWESDEAEAEEAIARATELAAEIGFFRAETVGLAVWTRAHLFRGNQEAADRASERAMELLERHGAELMDRITIVGTRCLTLHVLGREADSRGVLLALRRRMRESNRRITDRGLRRDQRVYAARLLKAVLSTEGPIYPRTPTRAHAEPAG